MNTTLVRSFALAPPLAASARRRLWVHGKPRKTAEKHALPCPNNGYRRHSPAKLLPGRASRSRHKPVAIVSVPTDIPGGDTVADK
jgi:hypothetical protein